MIFIIITIVIITTITTTPIIIITITIIILMVVVVVMVKSLTQVTHPIHKQFLMKSNSNPKFSFYIFLVRNPKKSVHKC